MSQSAFHILELIVLNSDIPIKDVTSLIKRKEEAVFHQFYQKKLSKKTLVSTNSQFSQQSIFVIKYS